MVTNVTDAELLEGLRSGPTGQKILAEREQRRLAGRKDWAGEIGTESRTGRLSLQLWPDVGRERREVLQASYGLTTKSGNGTYLRWVLYYREIRFGASFISPPYITHPPR